ncbi:MAG: TonB-dependent receptor [Bacteroidetes bacterium]|nr:TonB-dependent receptor [Bacteroidota bacterium]
MMTQRDDKKNMAGFITALIAVVFLAGTSYAQVRLGGTIYDKQDGKALSGANLILEKSGKNAVSDENGHFSISKIGPGSYFLRVSFIGYAKIRLELKVNSDTTISIMMEPAAILGEEVNVTATRAHDKYPVAYTDIQAKQIQPLNMGKDLPYLIQNSPSTVVTSDAGTGIGYTGINIRGTDLTRINVTLNGIPQNDPESQGVWFVDLPDIASSSDNIQIQRGVGTSTNGAGAFGASINIQTTKLNPNPYGELDLSAGSYNTFKSTLRFGTGLMSDHLSFDGRFSYIHSDGYIDRAFSDLRSWYLSGGYYGPNTTFRLILFSGTEKTYQAWGGVPRDSLETNRRFNPMGLYYGQNGHIQYYDNETDNYVQTHFQAIFSQQIMKGWDLNLAVHYTKGKGYYESYEQNAFFSNYGLPDVTLGGVTIDSTNLVNRKILDNDFCGFTFSSNYKPNEKLSVTLGGAWSRYSGDSFGKIIWAQFASTSNNEWNWYDGTGLKKDFNIFGKANYTLWKKLSLFADLQYRYVNYKLNGTIEDLRTLDQTHIFNFFNPKLGIFVAFSKNHQVYFSFAIGNREPSRDNYKDADTNRMPTSERLYDYELGYTAKYRWFIANANLFYMDYRNQLVLTGEINSVGEAVMVNTPHSYRLGIEISAGIDIIKQLHLDIAATFSRNRIRDFTQYIDEYDSAWNFTGQQQAYLGNTDLSFSPNIIFTGTLTYKPLKNLSFSWNSRYIGMQYIDNTSNRQRALHDYFINGLGASFAIHPRWMKEIAFAMTINNIFSSRYESNAWVYPYIQDGTYYESNGYFPQAPVNYLFGISLKI